MIVEVDERVSEQLVCGRDWWRLWRWLVETVRLSLLRDGIVQERLVLVWLLLVLVEGCRIEEVVEAEGLRGSLAVGFEWLIIHGKRARLLCAPCSRSFGLVSV